jgi:hypothetical protein
MCASHGKEKKGWLDLVSDGCCKQMLHILKLFTRHPRGNLDIWYCAHKVKGTPPRMSFSFPFRIGGFSAASIASLLCICLQKQCLLAEAAFALF